MTREVRGPTSPAVGIFWGVAEVGRPFFLLADLVPLREAELYGDFLSHGGHYEYWEKLAALSVGELRRRGHPTAPVWSEYEEWPRGRVVYHVRTGRFVVYADWHLRAPTALNLIVDRFGLPESGFDVWSDEHYVSKRRPGVRSNQVADRRRGAAADPGPLRRRSREPLAQKP
jgi:hypothetical protein